MKFSDETAARLLAHGMAPVNASHKEEARRSGFTATLYGLLGAAVLVLALWFGGL
jgi:hypothetical protein